MTTTSKYRDLPPALCAFLHGVRAREECHRGKLAPRSKISRTLAGPEIRPSWSLAQRPQVGDLIHTSGKREREILYLGPGTAQLGDGSGGERERPFRCEGALGVGSLTDLSRLVTWRRQEIPSLAPPLGVNVVAFLNLEQLSHRSTGGQSESCLVGNTILGPEPNAQVLALIIAADDIAKCAQVEEVTFLTAKI